MLLELVRPSLRQFCRRHDISLVDSDNPNTWTGQALNVRRCGDEVDVVHELAHVLSAREGWGQVDRPEYGLGPDNANILSEGRRTFPQAQRAEEVSCEVFWRMMLHFRFSRNLRLVAIDYYCLYNEADPVSRADIDQILAGTGIRADRPSPKQYMSRYGEDYRF